MSLKNRGGEGEGLYSRRKRRNRAEIEKEAFRWREMGPVGGLKSKKGRKFSKLKKGEGEDLYSCNIICHSEYRWGVVVV